MADIYIVCDLSVTIDKNGELTDAAADFFEYIKSQGYKLLLGAGNMTAGATNKLSLSEFLETDDYVVLNYEFPTKTDTPETARIESLVNEVNDYRQRIQHEREMPETSKKKFIFVMEPDQSNREFWYVTGNYSACILSPSVPDQEKNEIAINLSPPFLAAATGIKKLASAEIKRQAAYQKLETYYLNRNDNPKRIGTLHRFFSMITIGVLEIGFTREEKTEAAKALMEASNGRGGLDYRYLPALTSGELGKLAESVEFANILSAARYNQAIEKASRYQRI